MEYRSCDSNWAPKNRNNGQKPRTQNRYSQGTGTMTDIGIKGRKTGIEAPQNVGRDADELENVEDFFEIADYPEDEVKESLRY